MNRISGIFFQEPTPQLQAFRTLQSRSGNPFKKVSPTLNVYFHAGGRSQHASIIHPDDASKLLRHIVWVGTIHNRDEIVHFLNQSGLSVNTDTSDAQLALRLYNCVGHDVSRHLIGYYAFAVWNEETQTLFLSRDAIGAERLYYFHTNGFFSWGTEIRQVCFLAGREPILNESWIAEALTWSFDGCLVHTKDSPIQDVQAIPPGHSLSLKEGKLPQLTQWWAWEKYRGEKYPKDEDLVEAFRDLLITSVKGCLGTDPRVIADLSGGIDSSSVVSLACHLAEKGEVSVHLRDVLSYEDPNEPRFDDAEYQAEVVKRYGLKQHKFSMAELWFLQGLGDQDTYFDYPNPLLLWLNSVRAPKKFASELGFVTSLTGGGGDNILPSLSLYMFDCLRSGKLRKAWKEVVARSGLDNRPLLTIISDNILRPIKHRHRLWEPEIPEWLDPDFLQRADLIDRFKDRTHDLQGYPLSSQYDANTIRFASDRPFTVGKYVADPLGIDYRHPFMDRRLVHFALQLPPHIKRQPQFKFILRQAMKGILPDKVRLRTSNTNFSHFRFKGLAKEVDVFDDMRRNPMLAELGFVNLKKWEEALTRFRLGLLPPWNAIRPPTYTDSPLSVEVWLRTCLPQFHKAYNEIGGNS